MRAGAILVSMRRLRPNTDTFRIIICSLLAIGAMAIAMITGELSDFIDTSRGANIYMVGFLALWPTYTIVYVTWSCLKFAGLSDEELRDAVLGDAQNWSGSHKQSLGQATTKTSVSAASVAVLVTIVIAAQPAFRGESIYVALALLTVMCSWILMVVAFARSYMLLVFSESQDEHMIFSINEQPRFGEFVTLALAISTMGATSPAQIVSRPGWRLFRTNGFIAFLFNTVILSMMVSLLFAGLVGGSPP